ncbi:sulfur transfer complex subunit TusD [Buchnera aphidicola str. Ak (Acyrthosiphon kondoi)]|uniref:Sulfurtransferase TusD n=1 Tax=Buchnera aphidicola str. Ak (Acyrthosiphon kondoi) TaxID=1005090 RepID=G2LM17_9GAMM|nr:sulfurtransferase complex subunit TusD [Buchnera aphidicola]AEO08864.1 sulfur transfer complex subunit TusD [Buchnera aphidicola str. Ak (Acyrthosiphon kondoi)]
MNYTILVTGAAYGTQNSSTAFLFCKSLLKTKNTLHSIFFYCDGVLNANRMTTPAIDEFNLIEAWQELHKKHKVKLYVCNSAALRRGVIEDEILLDINIKKGNLAFFFQLSGLVELANSIKICDRIIQF